MGTNRRTLSIYWQQTKKYSWLFWLGTIGAVVGTILTNIIPPFIVAKAFNLLQAKYTAGAPLYFSDFTGYILAFAGFILLGVIVWRIEVILVWLYQIRVMRDIANRVFDFLQHQDYSFHTNRFGGALVTQTNRFINSYEMLSDEFTWSVVSGFTAIIASIVFLLFVSKGYALVLAAITIIYMLVLYKRARGQIFYNRNEATQQSLQTASLADAITNLSNITSFGREAFERKRFAQYSENKFQASKSLLKYAMKTEVLSQFMTASINIVSVISGILAITVFHAKAGVFVLAVSYTQGITDRLWQFGRVFRNINKAFGDAGDMTEILALEPEIKDPIKPEKLAVPEGAIEFSKVKFAYDDDKSHPVFPNLDLSIKGGQRIGLVGHSGGGKTTITKLILRLLDIQKGSLKIDNIDIRDVNQVDLRQHIAYVPQEPLLFHRSIAENIAYGKTGASADSIKRAARLAHAHEFIKNLPKGYDTLVGERGVKLSGGQRQRVAIARAMLKDAPILVLDEATSALDSESEILIQKALWKLMEGRTAIVIAHRLSTVQRMDRIVVLEDGKVVEDGSHKELIDANGVYAGLWAHQSGGFLDE